MRLLPMTAVLLVSLSALAAAPALAQRRLVHDTLGPDTPTGLSCGFCADERFGVVFRELPAPRRGLAPEDFPITLDSLEVGLAAAGVVGGACQAEQVGGTVEALVEIWAGTELPTGSITALPGFDAWNEGETLVFATDAAPLTLSVADASGRYSLSLNMLELLDEAELPIRVEAGRYLRVVVTLPAGTPGASDVCEPTYASPAGFPVRDDDGRIAAERSFIYAAGVGWLWNEEAGINGDWALRLAITPEGPGPSSDGGVSADGGGAGADAGATLDGGVAEPDAGGGTSSGGCRAGSPGGSSAWSVASLLALVLSSARRRRSRP